MTTTSLHPTPSSATVAAEQFRAVGIAIRKEAYLFLGALAVFAALAISAVVRAVMSHHDGSGMAISFGPGGAVPIMLVAILVPFAVWRSEDPARRAYHWSMPVARGPHTLIKLVSGWAWLMMASAVYGLFIVMLATVIPTIASNPIRLADTPAWEWLLLFTGPTLAYLITSIAVIASNHAWRWIGGITFGYWILIAFLTILEMRDAAATLHSITEGAYGLNAALFASVSEASRFVGMKPHMRDVSMINWIIAMPLWIIGAGIGVALASYRHSE